MKMKISGITFTRDGYGADDCWSAKAENHYMEVSSKPDGDGEWAWSAWADSGAEGVTNGRLVCFCVDGKADSIEDAMRMAAGARKHWLRDLLELATLAEKRDL